MRGLITILFLVIIFLSGCLSSSEIEIKDVDFVVKPGEAQVLTFGEYDTENIVNYHYKIESSSPIDVWIVPSMEEYKKFADFKTFTNFPSCKGIHVLRYDEVCRVNSGSGVIISNMESPNDAIVKLKVYVSP